MKFERQVNTEGGASPASAADGEGDTKMGPTPAGPREHYDQWRSLRTHSVENIMSVYKELFFAGFPCRLVDDETGGGARRLDEDIRPFPQSFVYDFFQKYGVIERFVYDENRGVGAVTFADGDAGEGCFISAHLSLVYPPKFVEDENEEGVVVSRNPQRPILIYLEFAQALSFVNTGLLLLEELQPGDMSRHLLRTFPRIERKFSTENAERVVMEWTMSTSEDGKEVLTPVGPIFPGGEVEVPEVRQSLWRILRPPGVRPSVKSRVTVLDLWFEYYMQYQVRKTQPPADRISNPLFLYAQRASVTQEFAGLDPTEPDPSGRGVNVAHRLIYDGAYHQILTLLCYKIKMKNDPSWASFMRDVFTDSVLEAVKNHASTATYNADRHLMNLQKSLMYSLQRQDHEEDWLKLPLSRAALNAMENVKFLRRVDFGEIDRKTGNDLPAEAINRLREKNKFRAAALDDAYTLFSDFSTFVDNYAPSGSASGLLSICEDPKKFRYEKGHGGYSAVHDTTSVFRFVWDIFWVPIVVMVLLVAVVLTLNYRTQ